MSHNSKSPQMDRLNNRIAAARSDRLALRNALTNLVNAVQAYGEATFLEETEAVQEKAAEKVDRRMTEARQVLRAQTAAILNAVTHGPKP